MFTTIFDPLSEIRSAQSPFTILVVEDDPSDAELLLHALEEADLKVAEGEMKIEVRSTAEGALHLLNEQSVDLVLTDLLLPGISGLDLISQIHDIDRNLPVLVVTRINTASTVVEAIHRGAFDYLVKPVTSSDLAARLHRAIRLSEIVRRHMAFQRIVQQDLSIGSLVGTSQAFQEIMRQIHEAAQGRATVLITGETGTGKGLIARAIHEQSRERDKPYQVIDCTTVPEGMMESELFGHVRGAFTGAIADKPGLLELANGGSVFLDEIGELPPALQAKLLRVLEDNEVRPVGGTRVKRVQMRFIAATNQDLEQKVQAGTFRKDLYYRLAAIVIRIPPLRERREDIPAIARYLVGRFGREMGKPGCYLEASATQALMAYHWPGNVRELRNVIERAVMLAQTDRITREETKKLLLSSHKDEAVSESVTLAAESYMQAKRRVLAEFTTAFLKAKLEKHMGHITAAAEDSGIPRQHFSRLVKRYLRPGEGGSIKF